MQRRWGPPWQRFPAALGEGEGCLPGRLSCCQEQPWAAHVFGRSSAFRAGRRRACPTEQQHFLPCLPSPGLASLPAELLLLLLLTETGAKMTSDIVCMLPVHFSDGILLFLEEDNALESDSWRRSEKCERTQILRNRDNYVLIAQPNEHEDYKAVFQLMTDQAIQDAHGIKFNIHIYEDSMPRGLPVAFTIEWNSKTYYMCVVKSNNKMRVEFKEGDLPKRIPGQTSNVIFNKMSISEGSSQFFKFESALEQGYFLAFERDASNITRLIVKKAMDEVDQTTEMYHSSFSPDK